MIEVTCPKCRKGFRASKPTEKQGYIVKCPWCNAKCRIAPTSSKPTSAAAERTYPDVAQKKPLLRRKVALIASILIMAIAVCLSISTFHVPKNGQKLGFFDSIENILFIVVWAFIAITIVSVLVYFHVKKKNGSDYATTMANMEKNAPLLFKCITNSAAWICVILLAAGISTALKIHDKFVIPKETDDVSYVSEDDATPAPTSSAIPTLSPDEYASAIAEEKNNVEKDTYNNISYEELARYPNNHNAETVKLSGTVIQVVEDADVQLEGYGLNEYRIAVNDDYNNIIYVRYLISKTETRILNGDNVSVYGLSCGLYSYNSLIGNVTLPLIEAQLIEVGE